MKIIKVEVFRLPTANSRQNSPIGCRVYTDAGIYGDGEAGMAYGVGGSAAFGMVCDLAELVIGMDPLGTELIWETMYKKTFWGQNGGPVVFSGIAAIDVALWDIKGKYFKVPVYQLLGGKVRSRLRTYASQLQFGWGRMGVSEHLWAVTPEDYAHNVKLAVAEGFDAVKIDFFDRDEQGRPLNFLDTTGFLTPKQLKMVEARMKAARDAAGDEVDIIMENHSYPDALGAVQLAQLAEKYRILAFEEPNTPTAQTVEYIAKYTKVPIANGERLFSRWQYAGYSIIFQFVSTKTISAFHHRYERVTLQVTTTKAEEVIQEYVSKYRHGISCVEAMGGYSKKKMYLLHTVVSSYEAAEIVRLMHSKDPNIIVNILKTENFFGGFYQAPLD